MSLARDMHAALERVAKWRSTFAGWQLGTRLKGDPECDAVRDHREATIMLRVEASAITRLLIEKGLLSQAEVQQAFLDEAEALDLELSRRFPGLRSVENGIEIYDLQKARNTMRGWKP